MPFILLESGRYIPQVGVTKFTAYAMLSSTAGVFIHFGLPERISNLEQLRRSLVVWIILAVIATVIAYILNINGMKKIGSNNVAIISGIGPVSTIITGNLILREKIFTAQIIGTVLVVAGVLLIGWKTSKNLEKPDYGLYLPPRLMPRWRNW